ncbi:beta-galactosidase [bacterium]|nr:beta-galactosidase [bacterium]
MRHFAIPILLLMAAGLLLAQDKPESLVLNGDFEGAPLWSLSAGARRVPRAGGGMCLEVPGGRSASQEIPTDGLSGTFSVACDVRAENVVPTGGPGYAYVAVYQLDAAGNLAAYHDFGQVTGTQDWRRFAWTFALAPQAATISLRCGVYNASGTAWFDNWTLVPGNRAMAIEEVAQSSLGGRPAEPTAAILREPGLPATGAASSPERLGKLLGQAGLRVEYLSAAEMADRRRLQPRHYALVALPCGASFPAVARRALIDYLHLGGSFISTGGYAFNRLLLQQDGRWVEEKDVLAAQVEEALKHTVLPDGGFERATDAAPIGGTALDATWRRDGTSCTIVSEQPQEGHACARVVVPADRRHEQRWYLDMPPPKGGACRVSGWMRSDSVTGTGMAYLAVYEYAGDKLVQWRDFGVARGTTPWKQYTHDFNPAPGTTRLHLKMGLYQASGTAWFDNLRLSVLGDAKPTPMSTATGRPGDGLGVAPSQIGAFDASFPLRRVARLQPGAEQYLFPTGGSLTAPLSGWAAAGVQGYDNARWVELLEGRDRFGRPRGAAGALMLHYNGYFSGSMWAFFGVENRDLFDGTSPWLDTGLVNTARFIARGLFLRNLKTDLALYRQGEPVKYQVAVQNQGTSPQTCDVNVLIYRDGGRTPDGAAAWRVTVPAGGSEVVEGTWSPKEFASDLYQVRVRLLQDRQPLDAMASGFMVQSPQAIAKGPELRFHDNYLHLGGQPLFVFGSDTYSNSYRSACENPWTWHLDHVAARDFGFNLYENLQFVNPGWTYSEADWRQFEAMAQSCQREGLVFMPCQLCGHDVAIGDKALEQQANECQAYAEHMRPYPGLLYYLNGDFQLTRKDTENLTALWNGWLGDKYGSAGTLKASWGDEMYGEWGKLAYPPPPAAGWASTRAADVARFEVGLTRRWVQRHVQAIRARDTDHPITSEYYQQPYGGLDLILSIGDQDLSNIGYFRLPNEDIEYLPLHLRLNDLRVRGKSVSLGEYGVKTHPAWSVENGAGGYHIVRTEEQQKELFMAVACYGLAMGASKVQNWCLRDASENCFPWGVFYPNGRVPKDVAYWHRNLSLVWRFLRPKYVPAEVTVLQPDSLRLGNQSQLAVTAVFSSFRTLLGLSANFNVLNEQNADALTPATKLLIWPAPYCPDDQTYQRVLQWVRQGGKLLVTGDLSYNWDRKRTRAARLTELCGVEHVRELAAPPQRGPEAQRATPNGQDVDLRPCLEARPTTARVLGVGVYRNKVGAGEVTYCADPLELDATSEGKTTLAALYASVLPAPNTSPGELLPAQCECHTISQPLQGGGTFMLKYPLAPLPGDSIRYPAFRATDVAGQAVAVSMPPSQASDAHVMILSLDRRPVPQARALLVAPLSAGKLPRLADSTLREPVLVLGDLENGKWHTLETRPGAQAVVLDEDTMTCLILVCEKAEVSKWTALVEQAATRPWEVKGY